MGFFQWTAKKILNNGIPNVYVKRCVQQHSPLAKCSLCRDVCPIKGIELHAFEPTITNCTGCGLCVKICPQQVFEMDLKKLYHRAIGKDRLVVGCRFDQYAIDVDVRISCLQQLQVEDVLVLADSVDELVIFADKRSCDECVNDFFPEGIMLPLHQYPFSCVNNVQIMRDKSSLDDYLKDRQMNRRVFLKHTIRDIRSTSEEMTRSEMVDWLLKQDMYEDEQPLAKRSLLIPIYRNEYLNCDPNEALSYPMLHANGCVFCGACANLCPQNAITMVQEEGFIHLNYSPTLCSKCDLCIDICRVKALKWQGELRHHDFIQPTWRCISKGFESICSKCGNQCYLEDDSDGMCDICHSKENHNQYSS